MKKVIYLPLMWLLLAPISAFGQMGQEVYYSQMYIDDSQSDPEDQNADGVLYISGVCYVQDSANPYGHSYQTNVSIYGTNGQSAYGDGGAFILWDGVAGSFSLSSTHNTSCQICGCTWENYSGDTATMTPLGYTELYYKFDSVISVVAGVQTCAYQICNWCVGCECYRALRSTTLYSCGCETGCPPGVRNDYKITTISIPFFGDQQYCRRLGRPRPLTFNPFVPVPSWDPNCSITIDPKPLP